MMKFTNKNITYYIFAILLIIFLLFLNIFSVKAETLTYSPNGLTLGYVDNNNIEVDSYNNTDIETVSIYGDNFHKVKDEEVGNPTVPHQYFNINGNAIGSLSTDRYICYILYSTFEFSDTNLSPKGSLFNTYGQSYISSSSAVTNVHANTEGSNYFYFYCADLHDTTLTHYDMTNYGFIWLPNDYSDLPVWGASEYYLSDYYSFDTANDMQTFLTDKSNYYSSQTTGPNEINTDDWFSPSVDTNDWNNTFGNWNSITSFGSTTPVSNLVSLPITFLSAVNNTLNVNYCNSVNYITLYNYTLVLPCPNLSQRLGSVWTTIDLIFSLMLIFSIGKSLVKTFARLSDMDTNIMYECYSEGMTGRSKEV